MDIFRESGSKQSSKGSSNPYSKSKKEKGSGNKGPFSLADFGTTKSSDSSSSEGNPFNPFLLSGKKSKF